MRGTRAFDDAVGYTQWIAAQLNVMSVIRFILLSTASPTQYLNRLGYLPTLWFVCGFGWDYVWWWWVEAVCGLWGVYE